MASTPVERLYPVRVVVCGCRWFNDYALLESKLDRVLQNKARADVQIVSGGAKGADNLAVRYAAARGLPCRIFHAAWATHKKAAGPIRNKEMAEYANHTVAFWDGVSVGTENMLYHADMYSHKIRTIIISK